MPAKAGIQYLGGNANWTPAFAGVTNSCLFGPHQ